MKKFILLLSAILLITSVSFAQKNVRAGKLDVKKTATFKGSTTFQKPVTFYDCISSEVTVNKITVSASGTWGDTYVIITGQNEAFVSTIIIPQTIILTGGTCDGESVTIFQAGWSAGNIMCGIDGASSCTDYTGTSILVSSDNPINSENHFNLYGNLDLNVRYKLDSHWDCYGPMTLDGTMFESITGINVVDKISNATHLWYSNTNTYGNYFKIDSVLWDGTNTKIWSNSLHSGLSASIDDVYLFTLLGNGGNLTMKGNLIVGDQAETNFKFSLHGDAKITGRLRVNEIGDTGTYNYSPQAVWISSDSILLSKEHGDYSTHIHPGDSIAKADYSWKREIKSSEYGDFSHLGSAFGNATLVIYNGADVGDAGITNLKAWHYPDVKFTLSEANGVFLKSFRGVTDPDISGWIMTNASGTACYVYPNAAGTGITVSTTKP